MGGGSGVRGDVGRCVELFVVDLVAGMRWWLRGRERERERSWVYFFFLSMCCSCVDGCSVQ